MLALVACGVVAASPANARADERTAEVWDAPFAISGRIDLLPLPMSDLLVALELSPIRALSFELGAGAGASQRPIFLGMLHLQATYAHWAPGIEVGATAGPFTWGFGDSASGFISANDDVYYFNEEHIGSAVLGRAGISLGYRSARHLQVRIHGGVTGLLNPGAAYCRSKATGALVAGCHADRLPGALPYLGASVGYAFDL